MALLDLDPIAYLSTPRTSARDYIALGRLLLRHKPKQGTVQVELAARRLEHEIDQFTNALAAHHRELDGPIEEAELDYATDGLWYSLCERLDGWIVFERKAFAHLAAMQEREGGFDYAACIAKARRARYLRRHLLGSIGTDFTHKPYVEQVEYMSAIWELIEHEQLTDELADLIGADFVAALEDCHHKYVAMVKELGPTTQQPDVNPNDIRERLWRVIVHYNATVVAMHDTRDPQSVAMIRAALRPVDMLREQIARQGGGIAVEGEDEFDIDALVAEQQAVNALLGFGSEPRTDES